MAVPTNCKQRLWVLPWGLYPRRVTIYLKEKGIIDQFEIIPVNITLDGMEHAAGMPPGTMPLLEVHPPSIEDRSDGEYIYQSTAILEYLEDRFGDISVTPNMRGKTPMEKARVRDCMSILNDANEAFTMYAHNGSKLFSTLEEQSITAAICGQKRMHHTLNLLDSLADDEGPWLAGSGGPTIADCMAMATVQFAWHVNGYDLTAGHPSLKRLYDAFIKGESTVMEDMPAFIKDMASQMSVR